MILVSFRSGTAAQSTSCLPRRSRHRRIAHTLPIFAAESFRNLCTFGSCVVGVCVFNMADAPCAICRDRMLYPEDITCHSFRLLNSRLSSWATSWAPEQPHTPLTLKWTAAQPLVDGKCSVGNIINYSFQLPSHPYHSMWFVVWHPTANDTAYFVH